MNKGNNKTIWILLAVILVGLVGFTLYTSYQTAPTPATVGPDVEPDVEYIDEEISDQPDEGITTDDIINFPDRFEGQTVNVKAEVEEWLTPRSFLLDAPGIINDNLLVVTEDPTYIFEDPEVFGDAIWEVEGVVDRFEFTVVTDTLDADLDADVFEVYEGRPYIRATSINLYED